MDAEASLSLGLEILLWPPNSTAYWQGADSDGVGDADSDGDAALATLYIRPPFPFPFPVAWKQPSSYLEAAQFVLPRVARRVRVHASELLPIDT